MKEQRSACDTKLVAVPGGAADTFEVIQCGRMGQQETCEIQLGLVPSPVLRKEEPLTRAQPATLQRENIRSGQVLVWFCVSEDDWW